jgi:hypothetical protein
LLGEVISYGRKSTIAEGASKSIKDQHEVNGETAAENNLPLSPDYCWSEPLGYGGDLYWSGGGRTGLEADDYLQGRSRPTLTRIVKGVLGIDVTTPIRGIVVWAQDRLWRDVGIASDLIEFFAKHDVALYDRNGRVDIWTPEGRQAVLGAAVAAQHMREMCAVNSARGVRKSVEKGALVTRPNVLGFRSAGKYTGKVTPIPDELELVRRIYKLYTIGEGDGPLGCVDIVKLLMSENYVWQPDLHSVRGVKRSEFTKHIIYPTQIRNVLKDPRYQGKQPHKGKPVPCAAYLVDGQTAVDPALFERAQLKLQAESRIPNAAKRTNYALTGLLCCAMCGQGFTYNWTDRNRKLKEGETRLAYWRVVKRATWSWCTHSHPAMPDDLINTYLNQVFAPLILAELRDQQIALENTGILSRQAHLRAELTEARRFCDEELPQIGREVSPKLLAIMEKDALNRIEQLSSQLQEADQLERATKLLSTDVERLADRPLNQQLDIVRALIRWVAVIPNQDPYANGTNGRYLYKRDRGRVVFLTTFGTYHTATIEQFKDAGSNARPTLHLRPAAPSEVVGSVAQFPDPEAFLDGLRRRYKSGTFRHCPEDISPGYVSKPCQEWK